MSELSLPGCFPSAPQACRSAADPFFACFTEKARKQSPTDTEAGESSEVSHDRSSHGGREKRPLRLLAGDEGVREVHGEAGRHPRNEAVPGEARESVVGLVVMLEQVQEEYRSEQEQEKPSG